MTSFVVITGKFAFAFACEWEIVDYLDFWPLLATCHRDDICEIGRVMHVEHVWDALRGFCDLVWAKTRFWGPFWTL